MGFNTRVPVEALYIHWPFCPYRCTFCPFVAFAQHESFMKSYHDALCNEIKCFGKLCQEPIMPQSIYFGGGTPSTYPMIYLLDMFDKLKKRFNFSRVKEITIEVNPGTITKDCLLLWKKIGINRLSIGVQSLNDKVLNQLNRRQSLSDVMTLFSYAAPLFSNISVDLIMGLPNISKKEWKLTLHEIVKWPIQHLSLYFLALHEKTKLFFDVQNHLLKLPQDEEIIDLFAWSVAFLKKHGFEQYEISNFARSGYRCKQNMIYWDYLPYKAFGVGGASFDGKRRFRNESRLLSYLKKIEIGEDVVVYQEELTDEQMRLEKTFLQFRQSRGVCIDEISDQLSEQAKEAFFSRLTLLQQRGLVEIKNNSIVLTTKGIPLENKVFLELFDT